MLKTKLQIIEETASYYSEDTTRRAMNDEGYCRYYTDDCKACAVGRLMINPVEFIGVSVGAKHLIQRNGLSILKEEYRHPDWKFFVDLQMLHDTGGNWNNDGLTVDGKKELENLREVYAQS